MKKFAKNKGLLIEVWMYLIRAEEISEFDTINDILMFTGKI